MKIPFRLLPMVVSFMLIHTFSSNILAEAPGYTLFAVDLSLGAEQKNTAYDVIQQTILNAPSGNIVGLTLFDDTVRGFVAPSPLDVTQIRALHDAIADSPDSVRATSNLAVGIERALDNLDPGAPANLIVYSRGVIDTATEDPRALFSEWLELILLPQATGKNIKITLVVPFDTATDPAIERFFVSSSFHNTVTSTPGKPVDPSLISILGIANRPFGNMGNSQFQEPDTAVSTTPTTTTATSIDSTAKVETEDLKSWLHIMIVLLAIVAVFLCGFFYWRSRSTRVLASKGHSEATSSTYLPLSEKPVDTMKKWLEENDTETKNSSSSRLETRQKEKNPWD